jgi:AcrR family transcriptional regulator
LSNETTTSDAYERVLNTAEQLFMQRGYTSVKLRDIANALGIKQASLYYHVPGGKEALFVAVVERNMTRHRENIQHVIADATGSWIDKMLAAADWLFSQPAMDLTRMIQSDLPALSRRITCNI